MLYVFVNLATVLNKYLRLCLFASKRDVKLADPAVFKVLKYSFNVFSHQAIRNTSNFVFLQLRSIFRAALFRARVCSLYHGVGLVSLIFLRRKGVTVS